MSACQELTPQLTKSKSNARSLRGVLLEGLKKDLHERVEAQVNKHAADNTTTRKEIQHLQQDFKIVNDMLSTSTQKQVELPNLQSKFDSLN